jgi:hypothetical protein
LHTGRGIAFLQEPCLVDDQDTVGLPQSLGHVCLHVVADRVPLRTVEEVLEPVRRTVTCVLGELPAALPPDGPKQGPHVVPHPPPKISPAEPVANPQQHLVQLSRPHIRAHIILHDQNNSERGLPVTNSRHMTASQLATLRNRLLTSSDSELQLEY